MLGLAELRRARLAVAELLAGLGLAELPRRAWAWRSYWSVPGTVEVLAPRSAPRPRAPGRAQLTPGGVRRGHGI